ncbi:hypothetical protein B0J11DRAFT_542537 [Dendryphion nanum]|uniref:Uncharacterized protein n=1 Tax=Dendryphion nanum TaxID=256645 RepID=A0A9P9D2Y9_9PLEO|nr:hypothetical protein B0J11DRAFT_542537 [Dendryphion nanum]
MPSKYPTDRTHLFASPKEPKDVPVAVDEIRAFVDATNTRIQYLEDLLRPSTTDQIAFIKRRLLDAHRGRRLSCVDRKLKMLNGLVDERTTNGHLVVLDDYSRKNSTAVAIEAYPLNPKSRFDFEYDCVDEDVDFDGLSGYHAFSCPDERSEDGELHGDQRHTYGSLEDYRVAGKSEKKNTRKRRSHEEEKYLMTGGLPTTPLPLEDMTDPHPTPKEEDIWHDAESSPMASHAVTMSTKVEMITNGHFIPKGAIGLKKHTTGVLNVSEASVNMHTRDISDGTKYSSKGSKVPARVTGDVKKTRDEVMLSVMKEESTCSSTMLDPDKKRQGSGCGFAISFLVITGSKDGAIYVPRLRALKIHEIRSMKQWLVDHGYLQRSGSISRMEKMLHLLFLMQEGLRFESVAVIFSRTPRQVKNCCQEVFGGLLELHSETVLPAPTISQGCLYRDLWDMIGRYERYRGGEYYPWTLVDIKKVIITVNFFIGRFRKQGQMALDGPMMAWGNYVRDGPFEDSIWTLISRLPSG